MRGSNHTCAISDAWTWSFICPEVKAGLTTHHPQITKPSHHRISHWKRPEGSPLPGPVTTIRGHGGCGPRSRKNYKNCSYPRHPAQDSNKHCQDNFMLGLPDTTESREAKVKMLYRFWMELSGNSFCVTKKKKKITPDLSAFWHTDKHLCFLKHIWICFYNSFPSPQSVYNVLLSRMLALGIPSNFLRLNHKSPSWKKKSYLS